MHAEPKGCGSGTRPPERGGDRWVPSICVMCYNGCPIRVHVRDGAVLKIEGDPDDPFTRGGLCARGPAGIMQLYDPRRVRKPLKRTNPEKGIGVDPGWVEISWEEAFDVIGAKLRKIREDNPNKLIYGAFAHEKFFLAITWPWAFGTKNGVFSLTGVSTHCANPIHTIASITHGAMADYPDLEHCRHLMVFGCGIGTESFFNMTSFARRIADARARGMKLVVVDPRLSTIAAKADEWVPIRPATDLALILGMIDLLVNEWEMYDAEYLRAHTNAPFLVTSDGDFVRDPTSGKPLVWDAGRGAACAFDEPLVGEPALVGEYAVRGSQCRPAFEVLRSRVREYPPAVVEEITSVPAGTVVRLAREFGEAARIGASIRLDGDEYPLRPAAVVSYRGLQAHLNGTLATLALETLAIVTGSLDAVGGTLARTQDRRRVGVEPEPLPVGSDGMVEGKLLGVSFLDPFEWPPKSLSLKELFPLALDVGHLVPCVLRDAERYGVDYRPEAVIFYHVNPAPTLGPPELVADALEQIDLAVDIAIYLDETAELCDIVLPEHSYLERHNLFLYEAEGVGLQVGQPVIPPIGDTKEGMDILMELADRSGCLRGPAGFNTILNVLLALDGRNRLDVDGKYTWVEVLDRWAKARLGDERGLEWLKQHGPVLRRKTPKEMYRPALYAGGRIPLYQEMLKRVGDRLRADVERLGVEARMDLEWDYSDYAPLPFWKPSRLHADADGYDLYCVHYKSNLHTNSDHTDNPWLGPLIDSHPYLASVAILGETARRLGIDDGDDVWVESREGRIRGRARLTEGIHPEVVAVGGGRGHWAAARRDRGVGLNYNRLLTIGVEYTDKVTGALECVPRVRVYRAEEARDA